MSRISKSIVFIALAFTAPVFADSISVGFLNILADSPTVGSQEVTIFNETGSNCWSSYTACANLNFTNWTLTVTYTSSYYNGTGPAEPSPLVYTDAAGFGDITPGANPVFDFDLCGGLSSCVSPVTTITQVEFKGQISPASFCLWNGTDGVCGPTTFFADSHFDMIWNGSSPQSPYVDQSTVILSQSPDIIVNSASTVTPPVTGTPEPGSLFLAASLIPVAWFGRRKLGWFSKF